MIKWKYIDRENVWEGKIDRKLAFSIEGTLCLTDLRFIDNQKPRYYSIKSIEDGKQIAEDLINNVNRELHEKNRQDWNHKFEEGAKLIDKVDEFLKTLK